MGSADDHSDDDTTWVPVPAMTFDIHVEVKHFLETYGKKNGFHVSNFYIPLFDVE